MKKHFVEFFSPGTFVAESSVHPVDSWDVDEAKKISLQICERYGSKPYGFQFFTRARTDDELDSKVIAKSGIYYINGVVKTLEEIKAENNPNDRILISNMESNGWDRVVTTYSPYKWTQPFECGDAVVVI